MFHLFQSPTFQWIAGITLAVLSIAVTVILWILSRFLSNLKDTLKEMKQLHTDHERKDDERFERHTDRIGKFEKEFSAEVRSALAASYDRYIELKDWVRERSSK